MANCCDSCCSYSTQQTFRWWFVCLVVVSLLAVVAGIVIVVLGLAVIHHVKANVEDARLNSFAFATTPGCGATTSFFAYNMSVALTVRNPNWLMRIKYTKPLEAAFVFHDRRLHNVTVVDEGHKHPPGKKEVHLLHASGKVPSYVLGTAAVGDFKKQNATGVFKVEVRLSGEITYLGHVDVHKHRLGVSCPLRLQLAPPGPEVVVFREVNCKPANPDNIYF